MTEIDRIKRAMAKKATVAAWSKSEMLSSGVTLINLAATGTIGGAFRKGTYNFLVGDSSSGKTFVSRTILAEASIDKNFDKYKLIYDDVEGGALMDTRRYFGSALADRLEPPFKEGGEDGYSFTIEDFYYNINQALESGPCIYVLDSMDALSSDYEGKKFTERLKARGGRKKVAGDYGDGKAGINSRFIRRVLAKLESTGSILIIICQTRDNIDAGLFQSKKTRSGGHALKFYATMEIWTSIKGRITKSVKGKPRLLGIDVKARIKKNRATGRDRSVEFPIYYSYGIDDIASCVQFLVEEKRWKKAKKGESRSNQTAARRRAEMRDSDDDSGTSRSTKISATELDFVGTIDEIVMHIEENNLITDLHAVVEDVWDEIERACELDRKPRYE